MDSLILENLTVQLLAFTIRLTNNTKLLAFQNH